MPSCQLIYWKTFTTTPSKKKTVFNRDGPAFKTVDFYVLDSLAGFMVFEFRVPVVYQCIYVKFLNYQKCKRSTTCFKTV